MHRLLIADRSPADLSQLEIALKCVPDVMVEAAVTDGRQTLQLIRQTRPDIAIIDAELPLEAREDFLEAVEALDPAPAFILVGTSDRQAYRAMEMEAADYLLKPISLDRLRRSLRRAQDRIHWRSADTRLAELHELISSLTGVQPGLLDRPYQKEIWVRDREGLTRIPVADVDMLEASGDYVIAHVGETTHILNETLSSLAARLDPRELLRIHRSSIINLRRVRSIRRRSRRGLAAVLMNGKQVAIGPNYTDSVLGAVNTRRWR